MKTINDFSDSLLSFFGKRHDVKKIPTIVFKDDEENSQNPLGKTAFYDPGALSITIFTTGRHIKDVLRSMAHELIHHLQCERGDLDNIGDASAGYAQKDKHLRNMEKEAYLLGNMCFRDWEDSLKESQFRIYETIYNNKLKGEQKMSLKNWKDNELNTLLMEKWGFDKKEEKKEEKDLLTEDVDNFFNNKGDYATADINPMEMTKEEEEDEVTEEFHPMSVDARLQKLPEVKLRKIIRKTIQKLLGDKQNG